MPALDHLNTNSTTLASAYDTCSRLLDRDAKRLEGVYSDYRKLYNDPANARPMIVVNVPAENIASWQDQLSDPLVMLEAQLRQAITHLEIGDDCVPAVRINFGTGQVAAAFGCELKMVQDNLPAVKAPALNNADSVYNLKMPALDAGWYGKLAQWTKIWKQHRPPGVHIQHPDIQSPFNTAHLIRGNDILTDLYDDPASVEALLDLVTDYMIQLVPALKSNVSSDTEWFFDWYAMWKGAARISNCSTTMIAPEFYKKYILPRDSRFLNAIGGGRMHYCGNSHEVIREFFSIDALTALDCDCQFHDVWQLARQCPPKLSLVFQQYGQPFPDTDRLLRGDWPEKRNIVLITQASSIQQGKDLYMQLKRSIPGD